MEHKMRRGIKRWEDGTIDWRSELGHDGGETHHMVGDWRKEWIKTCLFQLLVDCEGLIL